MENNTKKTLGIFLRHSLKYKLMMFLIPFSITGAVVTNVILPLYYKAFFDVLASGQSRDIVFDKLISILINIAFAVLVGWAFWRVLTFAIIYFQSRVVTDISNMCFSYLHKHSFSYFNNNFTGSLVKRVGYFSRSFEDIADRITWDIIPIIVEMIVITAVLFSRNSLLGWVLVVWTTIFLSINWVLTKYKLKYDILRSAAQTEATGFLADTITNNGNLKLFCGYKREVDGYFRLNEKVRRLKAFAWNLDAAFEAFQALLMILLEVGILYLAAILWKEGKLTAGDFVLLQSYVFIIFHKLWNFGKIIRHVYQNLADAEEMTVILNTPHEITDAPGAKSLDIAKGEIEFKNVGFFYHKTRKILDKFNLRIASNEKVALIGPSGAGKSTVVKLLLRNHDVDSGKILIDGQDISKITQESLWKNVSLVPQDPILFHRTLMENIRYGRPEATDEEVFEASRIAHCAEFIDVLPNKYETYVGERGIKLSGGERQRVAIARAVLRNSPILVLDEATSSLDSGSEHLIQDALNKLMENKTVIVIAHRLSTIVKMDRIIFIGDGRIIEEGTHKDLLEKENGHYKKLWQLQAGGFITEE